MKLCHLSQVTRLSNHLLVIKIQRFKPLYVTHILTSIGHKQVSSCVSTVQNSQDPKTFFIAFRNSIHRICYCDLLNQVVLIQNLKDFWITYRVIRSINTRGYNPILILQQAGAIRYHRMRG